MKQKLHFKECFNTNNVKKKKENTRPYTQPDNFVGKVQ